MFEITLATPEERESIRRLQGLSPYPETPAQGEATYFVARSPQMVVGAAGVELLVGEFALVRMLAVLPGYRKRAIARQLLLRLVAFAEERGIREVYAPGLFAEEYFRRFGFLPCPLADLPPAVRDHPFPGIEKLTGKVMRRSLQVPDNDGGRNVAATAQGYFDQGLFCAESVLAAVAEHLDVRSPLIPGIATGFCNGVAGTWGTCGSISGGVLAINMMLGRQAGDAPVSQNYQAVRDLIKEFHSRHGSTQCSELIACDLESKEGRRIYRNNHLRQQCREYVATAAAISLKVIEDTAPPSTGSSDPDQ